MEINPQIIEYGTFLNSLNSLWTPHEAQFKILTSLFKEGKKRVFVNCGRKFGKTELALYFLKRKALERPGSVLYYVSKTQESAKDIVWKNRRLQSFGPKGYLKEGKEGIKETEGSIHFKNGSSIYLVGSNMDVDSLVGVEPYAVVYDEYRTHNPAFHETMDPNYAPYDAQLLILSTPPKLEDIESGKTRHYRDMINVCSENDLYEYYNFSSFENPNENVQKYLVRKKEELYSIGLGYVWEREYMARIVPGDKNTVFGEISDDLLSPHLDVMRTIREDEGKFEFFTITDPSGQKRWGVLFAALDPYDKTLYLLDSIVLDASDERQKVQMSALILWDLIEKKMKKILPNSKHSDWNHIYDSSESFFANSVNIHVDSSIELTPVNKNRKGFGVEEGFSAIRDLISSDSIVFSDRVSTLILELQGIQFDPISGKAKKVFDELTDCLRYLISEINDVFESDLEYTPNKIRKVDPKALIFEASRFAREKRARENLDDDFYSNGHLWS